MVKKGKIVNCNRGIRERNRGIRRFFAAKHPAIEVYCDRRLFLTVNRTVIETNTPFP